MIRRPLLLEEIPHDGPAWREALVHRDRILRRPLCLILSDDDLREEARQRHFVLSEDGRIVAGIIAMPPSINCLRLRQMWVVEAQQGSGLGRILLDGVASRLQAEGIRELRLHARRPVIPFYEKCGYQAVGPEFEEIGIPHREMRRSLDP